MYLLDSDVLIDCLRGRPQAKTWLVTANTQRLGVPGVVAMELLAGCRNQNEQTAVERFTKQFTIVWPDAGDFEFAYDLMGRYRLSSGLGIPDCLIASAALRTNSILFTFNRKHFLPVVGLDVRTPYFR